MLATGPLLPSGLFPVRQNVTGPIGAREAESGGGYGKGLLLTKVRRKHWESLSPLLLNNSDWLVLNVTESLANHLSTPPLLFY